MNPSAQDCVEHANGHIQRRLQGWHRWRAHLALAELFPKCDFDAVEALAKEDPSLFIEPIPFVRPESDVVHDVLQRSNHKHGRWLNRAGGADAPTFSGAIKAVLEAGVRADDQAAFGGEMLLGFHHWRNDPELLQLALAHGAATDLPPAHGDKMPRSVLRLVLYSTRDAMTGALAPDGRPKLAKLLESARLLLDAGATSVDTDDYQSSGIGILCERMWNFGGDGSLVDAVADLVRRLHAVGGNIDKPGGQQTVPPVVEALRAFNLEAAMLLIELGARTDDEYLVRPQSKNLGAIRGLIEEARSAGKEPWAAQITEHLMRVRIGQNAGAPLDSAPQRRMRAV